MGGGVQLPQQAAEEGGLGQLLFGEVADVEVEVYIADPAGGDGVAQQGAARHSVRLCREICRYVGYVGEGQTWEGGFGLRRVLRGLPGGQSLLPLP